MNPFANGFSSELALDMLRRRLWLAITLFSVVVTAVVSLTVFLPNIYTTTALILVEGQQIPQDYVRSTVTMGLERRLQTINQEILSRSKLEQLAEQFGLYQDLKKQKTSEDAVATAMRQDLGIRITGRGNGLGNDTVVFEVSYTNQDPQKAMQVTNTLASFYIEENLKVREQQALGTSKFLFDELQEIKKKLEAQEQQVVEYKTKHMGELPEQLNANLSTLPVLQKQMEIASDNLARARERRNVLLQMTELDAALASLDPGTPQANPEGTRLSTLKGQLAELKTRFSDKHPDIIRLKQQIAALEERAKSRAEIAQPTATGLPFEASKMSSAQIEQATVDAEIKSLNDVLAKVQHDISVYKQRIENAPQRDQELTSISRDYTATRDLYASLLKRLDEAKLSDSLEERQKAERFRLLEPAVYPHEPTGPNRVRLFLVGFVLGLGAAIAGVLLWEFLDPSFHRVDDLKAFTAVQILGTVPQIITPADRLQKRRRLCFGTVALAAVLLTLVGIAHRISANNDRLVRLLVKPTSGIQLR
jgi:polysaccharide chain length determinant protein (PEP-CTERM system associated)